MFARTERLMLRPRWAEDAAAIHAAINDEMIIRNLARAPWPYTIEDAQDFIALEQDALCPDFLLWKRTEGDPVLIGACGIGRHEDGVELGYWIARPYWGQGYASEAARTVLNIARSIGHDKITCGHFIDNPASGKVMRKLGFRPTGRVEKRHSAGRGGPVDCVLMELPADEGDAVSFMDSRKTITPMPKDAAHILRAA